jgi:hypothetical protein
VVSLLTTMSLACPLVAHAQDVPPTENPPTTAPSPAPTEPSTTPEAPDAGSPTSTPSAEKAAVDDEREKKDEGGERKIKDHVFIFPAFVTTSIIASYVGVRMQLGTRSISGLPTEAGRIDIETVTFAQGLDGGIKITDWLGLAATGAVRSLVGSNLQALVYDGATYDFGGIGSVIVRLFRSDRTGSQLSLIGTAGYSKGQVASLLPLVDQPVQAVVDLLRRELGESIKTPFSTITYGGRLAYAQSISPLFGVQASAGLGGSTFTLEPYNRDTDTRASSTTTEVTYNVGVAPSVDFMPLGVPLAIMPEYLLARTASSATVRGAGDFDTIHQLVAGAYYSGRKTLQLGLIWAAQLGQRGLQTPQGQSDSPTQQSGQLVLRYVW